MDQLTDSDVDEQTWFDTLDSIDALVDDKIENISLFIKEKKSDIDQIDDLVKTLQAKKAVINRSVDWLKDYIAKAMETTGKDKYKSTLNSIYFMKTKSVDVVNEKEIPSKFKKVIQSIDKKSLKEALKNGEAVSGAELKVSKSLVIR